MQPDLSRVKASKRLLLSRAVSIYTYIHTDIHTYIHTYIHTHIHTYIHTQHMVAISIHMTSYLRVCELIMSLHQSLEVLDGLNSKLERRVLRSIVGQWVICMH